MINSFVRITVYTGMVLYLAFSATPARSIEKVDVDQEEPQPAEKTDETKRIDIYLGLYLPYSTVGDAYDHVREISLENYNIVVPKVHGRFDWGGIIGVRQLTTSDFGAYFEISVYHGNHNYSRSGISGKAELTSFNVGFCASYTKYPVHPLFYLGASLLSMDLQGGAEDTLNGRTDASFNAAATNVGAGFNLPLHNSVWLSSRIAYRRYWFYSVEIAGNDHTLDKAIKADGLWLMFSLNAGIRIK